MRKYLTILSAAALTVGTLSGTANADPVADFYKKRQVTMLVAFGAGGGYGLYARTVAQHMGKHIPGNPTVITQFMSGAGGAKAANYFANAAPQDGTMIGLMSNAAALAQVMRGKVKYDASKFHYLGRAASMESALIVWHTAKATNFKQWMSNEVIFGSTGKASQDYFVPMMASKLLGVKVKMVMGYKGSRSINKAMEQGEVQAMSNSWSSVKARLGQWLADGKINTLAINGLVLPGDAPKVPLLVDMAKNANDRKLLEFIASAPAVGRAFSAPPGVTADRVAALRKAFEATMKDSAFLADAKKRKMDLNVMSGADVQKIVNDTVKTPPAMLKRIKSLL